MAPMYYRGAKAAILVFDLTNEDSFHKSKSWLKDLKAHADSDVVVCIAGNKCDKDSTFDLKQCEEFAESVDAVFVRTSAQSGEGVDNLFANLTRRIVDILKRKGNLTKEGEDLVTLDGNAGGDSAASNSCC